MGDLEGLFNSFCAFGGGANAVAEMDNAKFAKFCRDTKTLDKKFTSTDADLLFTKVKPKGGRKIQFGAFRDGCLPEIAKKKGISVDELVARITGAGGPSSNSTKAEAVRFHDDKESYTGVYKQGGPSTVDRDPANLAYSIDRDKKSNVRGAVE
eukprot:TRINITY_DN104937_c0_g1_i1.p1 TRINITY_DN104937_c0_g1~~TRINITY_DN104937_c0_g1_i1.p1  ORF type:complete len:153 (-),score=14.68 TRINITY_DN104937_c0_g1_i1:133-591(-)